MAKEYRVFWVTPGVKAPKDSTGVIVNKGGGIMWIGEEETFPTKTVVGNYLIGDTVPADTYAYRLATEEEIELYWAIVNNTIPDEEEI